MDIFTLAWVAWLAIFAVVEGIALANRREGDTLSEHVWEWFGTARDAGGTDAPKTAIARGKRFVLLAFMAWLAIHFLTGGWV